MMDSKSNSGSELTANRLAGHSYNPCHYHHHHYHHHHTKPNENIIQSDILLPGSTPVRIDSPTRSSRRFTTPTADTIHKSQSDPSQPVRMSSNHSDPDSTTTLEQLEVNPLEAPATATSNNFHTVHQLRQDPLQELARITGAGSKRNALLKWCQSRVHGYPGVEVTNFSRSWNNGLALCALLHTYIPSKIPWNDLVTSNGTPIDKRRCFEIAFKTAESEGIPTTLHLQDMLSVERPDWNTVLIYITSIYKYYEVESISPTQMDMPDALDVS